MTKKNKEEQEYKNFICLKLLDITEELKQIKKLIQTKEKERTK